MPLLAFVLRELYYRSVPDRLITADKYEGELGGLEGCLTKVADGLLGGGDGRDGES